MQLKKDFHDIIAILGMLPCSKLSSKFKMSTHLMNSMNEITQPFDIGKIAELSPLKPEIYEGRDDVAYPWPKEE